MCPTAKFKCLQVSNSFSSYYSGFDTSNLASVHRVCTQRPLDLPAEVLLEILDHIQAADDMGDSERHQVLSNLACVSRYFYTISAPRIFRSLRFGVAQCDPRAPSWIEFCTQLISEQYSPPWMAHVIECSFAQWEFLPAKPSDFTGLYAHAVTKFTHLNSISFEGCPVNGTFFDAMLSLKNLKSIAIVNCYFELDMTTSHISNLSHLHLAAFELSGDGVIGDVGPCYIEALADLISTSSLRFLRTNNHTLTQAVINHPVDFLIDQLHVCLHSRDVSIFGGFLNRTPSITHLSISITPHWERPFRELSTSFFGLSSSSLPRLSAVTCPPVFISEFISGRSVSQIDLSDSDHARYSLYPMKPPKDVSIDLSSLDVTMSTTELHIWLESYLRNDLKAIFPKLDLLHLYCLPYDYHTTVCDAFQSSPEFI